MKKKNLQLQKKLLLSKESVTSLDASRFSGGFPPPTTPPAPTCVPQFCEISAEATCPIKNTCNQNTCVISCAGGVSCIGTMSGCGC